MNQLEILLLGPLKVQLDGSEITDKLRTKKELALLAYLSETPERSHPREILAELFWPNRPENYARMNLRQALLGIRKALTIDEGDLPYLLITENSIRFNESSAWLDTAVFRKCILATQTHRHIKVQDCPECISQLEQALRYYRGDFLEDLLIGDVTGFQEWIYMHRERLFHQMLDAMQLLSWSHFQSGGYDQAFYHAWRCVELAPLEESTHRLVMRLLALSGRRNAALQQYQVCKTFIERELGVEPSAETIRLFEQIREGEPVSPPGSSRQVVKGRGLPQTGLHPFDMLYDPHTHIPTRPLFMDRLGQAIHRMQRDNNLAVIGALHLSIPENDKIDLETRTQVEHHVIRRLLSSVRESDTISHLGRDQFGVILESIKEPNVIQRILQKILLAVSSPVLVKGQQIEPSPALGISIYPTHGVDANTLLTQAEIAMRNARAHQAPLSFFSPS